MIIIFLVHHLIIFFKNNLTIPKVKDLVNAPSQKYKKMLNIISHNSSIIDSTNNTLLSDYTRDELLPKVELNEMKMELKNFLKEQINLTNDSNINTLNDTNPQYYSLNQ
jgi:hypothetical protein